VIHSFCSSQLEHKKEYDAVKSRILEFCRDKIMSQLNWLEILDWDEEYLDNLRSMAFLYLRQGRYDIAKDFFPYTDNLQSK